MSKIFFKNKDNFNLCGIWHLPKEKTDKVIVLAHGITVDKDESGIFANLADELIKKGYAVFRFDFRGHGESEGKSVDMTVQGEINDLTSAISLIQNQGYSTIGLLGASFGGGVATLFSAKNQKKIKCLCLWNPVLNYDHVFLRPTVSWIKEKQDRIKKDFDEKGWAELGSRKFKVGKPLFEEMKGLFPFQELKKLKIPVMIIHGDKDTNVPFEDSNKYIENCQCPKEFVAVLGSEHGFHAKQYSTQAISKTLNFFQKYL